MIRELEERMHQLLIRVNTSEIILFWRPFVIQSFAVASCAMSNCSLSPKCIKARSLHDSNEYAWYDSYISI